jgi:hypothetical protein
MLMKIFSPLVLMSVILLTFSNASAIVVSSVGALQNAVNNANSGGDANILIASGEYDLSGIALQITANGVTVRGQSGNRSAVILDNHYVEAGTSGIFRILASNVTIADMTLQHAYYHAIHISPGGSNVENVLIDNVHIIDPGEQAIKINPDSRDAATYTVNNGIIRDCMIELTSTGRENLTNTDYSCYTGGIDAHWAADWIVQDNIIKGFWCSTDLSEHGIHFWNNSSNIIVERNRIIDCDRGIGFGLGLDGNSGGIIRNNMIYHGVDHGFSDVGISVESTPDAQIYNNTIYHVHNYSAIEYRFDTTSNVHIANNLTNRSITRRDDALALVENNVTNAQASWFVSVPSGNLHLATAVAAVVDQGMVITGLTDDFDGGTRPYGSGHDIGADEYGSSGAPSPPTPPSPPVDPGDVTIVPILHLLQSE